MVLLNYLTIIIVSYLVGSFPTAIIVGKLLRNIDIREHGSGNAGGTNVFRVLGWKPGVFVIVFDMIKGLVATLFVSQIAFADLGVAQVYLQMLSGISAIFGHIWTIFAGFKGGKGVGTAAGMLFGLYPIAIACCLVIFFIVILTTRYVSLGSILAAACLPIILLVLQFAFSQTIPPILMGFAVFIALLIIYTHRTNIKRLMDGTENRFGKSKTQES